MKPNEFLICLDAGHGGLNPKLTIPYSYTTYPSKCFQHKNKILMGYGWFFEGVFNRKVCSVLESKLTQAGFYVLKVYDEVIDTTLAKRVTKANFAAPKFTQSIYVSIHGNAANNTSAHGWELFTSTGNTKADVLASLIINKVREILPTLTIRTDMSDGDEDREENFYVLRKTTMPSILSENGFFTNYKDALMMMSDEYIEKIAMAHYLGIVNYYNIINKGQ